MAKQTNVFPEDVLVATLHLVGDDVRIPNDQRLAAIFDDAAREFARTYRPFAWNPLYRHSTVLSDTLQHIDLGGAIVRENAPTTKLFFKIAARTAGEYGANKLLKLPKAQRAAVREVARRIRERFAQSPETGQANRASGRSKSTPRSRSMV